MSARYAAAVCLIVGVALVPTLIHSYAGMVVTDTRTTKTIPDALVGFTSSPSGRDAGWGERRFESPDWIERKYSAGKDEVLLTVIRSYDLKRLYHHPELDVAYGVGFLHHEVATIQSRPNLPLHVLRGEGDDAPSAVYVLSYGEGFVLDPLWFQVRTAGELLVSGRKPMTLFFARDLTRQSGAAPDRLPSTRVLTAALEHFLGTPVTTATE